MKKEASSVATCVDGQRANLIPHTTNQLYHSCNIAPVSCVTVMAEALEQAHVRHLLQARACASI